MIAIDQVTESQLGPECFYLVQGGELPTALLADVLAALGRDHRSYATPGSSACVSQPPLIG